MNTDTYVQTETDCSIAIICKWRQSRLYEWTEVLNSVLPDLIADGLSGLFSM